MFSRTTILPHPGTTRPNKGGSGAYRRNTDAKAGRIRSFTSSRMMGGSGLRSVVRRNGKESSTIASARHRREESGGLPHFMIEGPPVRLHFGRFNCGCLTSPKGELYNIVEMSARAESHGGIPFMVAKRTRRIRSLGTEVGSKPGKSNWETAHDHSKRRGAGLCAWAVVLTLSIQSFSTKPALAQVPPTPFVADRLVIDLTPLSEDAKNALLSQYGLTVLEMIPEVGLSLVQTPPLGRPRP